MRLALVLVAAFGLLAGTAAAALPSYDPTRMPGEAEFLRTIQPYESALAANPKDADAAYELGRAYWEASVLYRNGTISYGADYLDKSIAALERATRIDDRYLAAWLVLVSAYHSRGDEGKAQAAAEKAIALAFDLGVMGRAVPRAGARNQKIAVQYVPLPDRAVRFNPADYFVIGDRDTKLVYKWPCASLPPIAHGQLFLTKWEAFDRGYKPGTVCTP